MNKRSLEGATPKHWWVQIRGGITQLWVVEHQQFIKVGACFEAGLLLLGANSVSSRASRWVKYLKREVLK